jgi:hypothetical protein
LSLFGPAFRDLEETMALDDIAPDVTDEELRGGDETPVVEQKTEVTAPEVKEEAKTEEVKAEAKETKDEGRVKLVPHEALHEARERAKEYRARLEQMEKDQAEYRKSIEAKLERLVNPAPAKPEFDKDPAGHLKSELEETRQTVQKLAESSQTSAKQQEQERAQREITVRTQAMEAEFVKSNPDYAEAIAHLQKVANANLEAMGIEDPAQRAALVAQQSLGLAHQALQSGKNPAAVAYQLAKNYGYAGKKTEVTVEEKKLESIAKGQKEASSSLGGGGERKAGAITLAELEKMSDEDLDKLLDDPVAWKKLGSQMV